MELAWGGSITKGATLFSLFLRIKYVILKCQNMKKGSTSRPAGISIYGSKEIATSKKKAEFFRAFAKFEIIGSKGIPLGK